MFSSKFWLCTLVAAVLVVVLDSAAALQSVCSLSKPNFTRVSCRGSDVKKQWFYKADEQRCKPFISCSATQVEGEVNSFNSLAECSARCIGVQNAFQRRSSAVLNETRCPEPTPIQHGVTSRFNNTVTYTCQEGFVLVGEQVRYCLDNRTWDSEEPRCDPIAGPAVVKCPTPQPIDYMVGAAVSCYNPGCTVNYTCQNKYTLVGDRGRACNSNGEWIGTPVCAKLVLLYNQTAYNDQQLELANGITKVHIECIMLPRFFPADVQPRWEKQSGAALGEGSRDYWGPGLSSYWLYFDKLLPEQHSGTYTCTAGPLKASLKLKVLPATPAPQTSGTPTLISDIQNLTKMPGMVAQFACMMRGQPVPQLTWLRDQQPPNIDGNSNMQLIQQNFSDTAVSIIIISSVSQSNAGTYTCTGSNSAGIKQASATLTVAGRGKRSVSEFLTTDAARGAEQLCSNSGVTDTVTVVGRVRQHTATGSRLDAYQVQINSVLSGPALVDEGTVVTVVTIAPQLPYLRRGSRFVFQGTMFGSELYILNSDSIVAYTRQLEALIKSC